RQIGENSRALISHMSDMVWSINPDNDNFDSIGSRMRDFAASMLRENDIAMDILLPEQDQWPKLDMQRRKNIFLIYKEAVHNVFKHARCSTLTIRVRVVDDSIVMTIVDNGIGYDSATKPNGSGLKNMRRRAEQMGAILEISSSRGEGTALKLVIHCI
ncbi:MAG: sensor histidine kinase, partial [Flavobacteriales bacterium]